MVAKGYKQTEIGVIPEDWEVTQLKKNCKLINGRGFKPHEWQREGLPIIRIQNLNGSDEYNYFQGAYDKKLEVEHGQLLFAWSGSRGTSFGPHIWHGGRGLLNYHTWKLVVNRKTIDSNYFFHALKKLTKFIEDKAHGASALVHTQKSEMEDFFLPIPPKQEQKVIAKALSDTDELIVSLKELIAKKEAIKTATMQQLLTGKKRLPGFSGEWVEKKLEEVCDVRDGTHDSPKYHDSGVKFITSKNIVDGALDFTELKYISKEDAFEIDKRSKVDNGDIIMSMIGTIGNAVLIDFEPDFSIKNVALFKPKLNKVNPIFFIQMLHSSFYQGYIESKLAGGIQKFISLGVLRTLDMPIPKLEEQKAIATILTDMDKELETLKTRLEKTKAIKVGMMQELLTGKTRLKHQGREENE